MAQVRIFEPAFKKIWKAEVCGNGYYTNKPITNCIVINL